MFVEKVKSEGLAHLSWVLAERAGATVLHGPNAAGEVIYAETTRDGDELEVGAIRLRVLETPGHTDDSLSFAFFDPGFGDDAVGELPEALKDFDRETRYTVMCGSGSRATIAASLMRREGFRYVDLYLGSISAWTSQDLGTAAES